MRTLTAILLLFTLFSCELIVTDTYIPVPFETKEEAWQWMVDNIEYEEDGTGLWPHPAYTYQSRKADCQGFSALFAYYLTELGYDVSVAVVYVQGGYPDHAMVYDHNETEDVFMEPQQFNMYFSLVDYSVDRFISMDYLMTKGYLWR